MVKKGNQQIIKTKKFIKEYISLLREDSLPIERIYFYGSRVNGNYKKGSDIDVCIVSPKFKSRWDAFDYLWSKRRKIDVLRGIEPVGYPLKDFIDEDPLVYEIKKTGVEIK